MTEAEARQIRAGYETAVKTLSRMTKAQLRESAATIRRARGIILVSGGPQTKDELIRFILDTDYQVELLNETTHVLYHKPGENWSACEHCQTTSVTA